MTSKPFASPPSDVTGLSPFKISVPEQDIQDFTQLLKLSKIGPDTYENSHEDHRYGISCAWMSNAKAEWLKFDWPAFEKRLSGYPQFVLPVGDEGGEFKVHFAALFSEKKDAIPIVFLHGWPGSFLEFLPIMDILKKQYTPQTLPYHIIVPSLPGYAFSSPMPLDRDFGEIEAARIINSAVTKLGFDEYIVQGGDIGGILARILAVDYPQVKAVHTNFAIFRGPPADIPEDIEITSEEQGALARMGEFFETGWAYGMEHGTRPATIGLVLSSSPLALLGWIGEKLIEWTDTTPPLNTILEMISLYWYTETFPRSIYPYRSILAKDAPAVANEPRWHVKKPMGYSWFPKELINGPQAWLKANGNLVFFKSHDSGGHFAALEKPDVLLKDVEEFVQIVFKKQ